MRTGAQAFSRALAAWRIRSMRRSSFCVLILALALVFQAVARPVPTKAPDVGEAAWLCQSASGETIRRQTPGDRERHREHCAFCVAAAATGPLVLSSMVLPAGDYTARVLWRERRSAPPRAWAEHSRQARAPPFAS